MATIQSVIIDSNEAIHTKLKFIDNPPVMTMPLEEGDIIINCSDGNILAIERKSPNDLVASIEDNRLFNQAVRMKKKYKFCYVVITGGITPNDQNVIINGKSRLWSFAAIQGALLSVQEKGVGVIHCNGEDDFCPCLVRLAARNRGDSVVEPVRHSYIFEPQEATLASLPGIGVNKAHKYYKMFNGNLADAIKWLCDPNSTDGIDGWGKKSAQTLKEYFGDKEK